MPANKLAFPWKDRIDSLNCTAEEYIAQNSAGMTDAQIAESLAKHTNRRITCDTVSAQRKRLGIAKTGGPNTAVVNVVSQSPFARYDSPPEIESDRIVIFPDCQFPYHHADFVNRVLDLCDKWKIKDCILAGDVLENASLTHFDPQWIDEKNIDDSAISEKLADDLLDVMAALPKSQRGKLKSVMEKHGRQTKNKTASGASEEWHHARIVIREVVAQFDKLIWICGNHEGRLLRQVQSPLLPQDIKRLFIGDDPKVEIAPYYYAVVRCGNSNWRVIHPRSSAKGDAKHYVAKFLTNIAMAHSHQVMAQKDKSGRFWALEIGAMVDESRLAYASQRDNKSDQHLLGALILRDGYHWLLTDDVDWKSLGKMA